MKTKCYKILICCFLCLFTEQAIAYHIIGGEIFYECLGIDPANPNNKLYRIIIKIYRDCAGGGQDFDSLPGASVGTITVYEGDNTTPYIETVFMPQPSVTMLEPSAGNPCLIVPPNLCVQEGIYELEISLPISTESYHITYQRCCRNSTISNIYNPDETGATFTVELTAKAQEVCNSTPVFNNFPPIVICVDQALNFDHSATDAEGDQLVYEFCSPLKGGGLYGAATAPDGIYPNPDVPPPYEGVDFVLPTYSPLAPLGGSPVVNIDDFTGLITGTPTVQGQFVVGICVKEYRDGELLSSIQRDFQFNVSYCEPTVVAELAGDPIDEVYHYLSCSDSTFEFVNESFQSSFIEEYLWQFEVNGTTWSYDSPNVTVTFPGPGLYSGQMILNPGTQCSDTADVEVLVAAPITADFSFEYDTCVAGPVVFTDLSATQNGFIEAWNWQFGDGNVSSEIDPEHLYQDPGLWDVNLSVTDDLGCEASITQSVNWYPAPPIIIIEPSSFVGCPPAEIYFSNLSSPIDSTYDIVWDFGDGGISGDISPTYVYQEPGVYDISIEITSPIGCYTDRKFSQWISIDSMPVADFTFSPDQSSNFDPEVSFTDQSKRAVYWNWQFDEYFSTIGPNPVYTFPDTGLMEVQLVITHLYGCVDSITKYVDIEPIITYFLPNAFTPNDDSKNEFFRGGGFFRGIRDFDMKVLNRWGEVIFTANDPHTGWNGRKQNSGKPAPNGVYVYLIRFTGPRGQAHEYQGFITLIR